MSNDIGEYFSKYPGLKLIENPKKTKRVNWFTTDKVEQITMEQPITTLDKFKTLLIDKIADFNPKLKSHQHNDYFLLNLESLYYYYLIKQTKQDRESICDVVDTIITQIESDTTKDNLHQNSLHCRLLLNKLQ